MSKTISDENLRTILDAAYYQGVIQGMAVATRQLPQSDEKKQITLQADSLLRQYEPLFTNAQTIHEDLGENPPKFESDSEIFKSIEKSVKEQAKNSRRQTIIEVTSVVVTVIAVIIAILR